MPCKFWRSLYKFPAVKKEPIGKKTQVGYVYSIEQSWNWLPKGERVGDYGTGWIDFDTFKSGGAYRTLAEAKASVKDRDYAIILKRIKYDKGAPSKGKRHWIKGTKKHTKNRS